MKNLVDEKPTDTIYGRSLYSTIFMNEEDIAGKTVLDIGCGFGWMVINLIQRNAAKVIGIEISTEDLITAKLHVVSPRVEFRPGSAIALPFGENVFETIVAWEVIEHIPKNTEDKFFFETARVLKKNGLLYMSTPYDTIWSKLLDPAWLLIGHRHYRERTVLEYARAHGFRVEKIVINGAMWESLSVINHYVAKWIFRRKPFFRDFFIQKLNAEFVKEKGFCNIFLKLRKVL